MRKKESRHIKVINIRVNPGDIPKVGIERGIRVERRREFSRLSEYPS